MGVVFRVRVGDSYLSPDSIDEIGYFTTYYKAFKALKDNLRANDQKLSFMESYYESDVSGNYQGNWIEKSSGYEGAFEIAKIQVE